MREKGGGEMAQHSPIVQEVGLMEYSNKMHNGHSQTGWCILLVVKTICLGVDYSYGGSVPVLVQQMLKTGGDPSSRKSPASQSSKRLICNSDLEWRIIAQTKSERSCHFRRNSIKWLPGEHVSGQMSLHQPGDTIVKELLSQRQQLKLRKFQLCLCAAEN